MSKISNARVAEMTIYGSLSNSNQIEINDKENGKNLKKTYSPFLANKLKEEGEPRVAVYDVQRNKLLAWWGYYVFVYLIPCIKGEGGVFISDSMTGGSPPPLEDVIAYIKEKVESGTYLDCIERW
ncbi:MAG: hypothetical protein WBB28_01540 [Crinalium sp.]